MIYNSRYILYIFLILLSINSFLIFSINYGTDEFIMFYNYKHYPFYYWFYNEWGYNHGYFRPLQILLNYPAMLIMEVASFRYAMVYSFMLYFLLVIYIYRILSSYYKGRDSFVITMLFATNSLFFQSFVYLTDNSTIVILAILVFIIDTIIIKKIYSSFVMLFLIILAPYFKESGLLAAVLYLLLSFYLIHNRSYRDFVADNRIILIGLSVIIYIVWRFAVLNILSDNSIFMQTTVLNNSLYAEYGKISYIINWMSAFLSIFQLKLVNLIYANFSLKYCIYSSVLSLLWATLLLRVFKNVFNKTKIIFNVTILFIFVNSTLSSPYYADRIVVYGFLVLYLLLFINNANELLNLLGSRIFKICSVSILVLQCLHWGYTSSAIYKTSLAYSYSSKDEIYLKLNKYVKDKLGFIKFLDYIDETYPVLDK